MTHIVHETNCYQFLWEMKAGSVDAVITDPPYGVDYASWDLMPTQNFLYQSLRVSRGPVLWFGASPPACLARFLAFDPPPERMLVWAPGLSFSRTAAHGMFYQWHPIWCWNLPKKQDVLPRDVLTHATAGRQWWNHPATKPVPLMVDLVRAFCPPEGTVLDPFCGSGSTLVAAAKTGRNSIGCELNPEYAEVARKRIEMEGERFPLFADLFN